jgi:5,10-methylene-tetrahydrofolate dehydrogenase/methenyl tetrahydrofolate cyclohydrolase
MRTLKEVQAELAALTNSELTLTIHSLDTALEATISAVQLPVSSGTHQALVSLQLNLSRDLDILRGVLYKNRHGPSPRTL